MILIEPSAEKCCVEMRQTESNIELQYEAQKYNAGMRCADRNWGMYVPFTQYVFQ